MEYYKANLAVAYVRGVAPEVSAPALLPEALVRKPLVQLTPTEIQTIVSAGEAAGLRMYHFKEKERLPRVRAVLGFLRSVQPESLLDVGRGRGAFLFPCLSAPEKPGTCGWQVKSWAWIRTGSAGRRTPLI